MKLVLDQKGPAPRGPGAYFLFYNPLRIAGKLSFDAPVGFLDVLEDDVNLVRRRLADADHRVGDCLHELALLLVGAPRVPLDRDVRHNDLLGRLLEPGALSYTPSRSSGRGGRTGMLRGRARSYVHDVDDSREGRAWKTRGFPPEDAASSVIAIGGATA